MPTEAAFRLSVYLTLALSCAALGYSEYDLLPEAGVVAFAVVLSLAVLYRLETRVELLSIPAANRLGLFLGVGNFVWAAFRMLREINAPQMQETDWPVLGVALIGPLVMTLMPAKLARREKHAGDYWWLYGLALATAALAGALADDVVSFVLIGLYAACAVWSLSVFYLRRAGGAVLPVPGQQPDVALAGVATSNSSRWGFAPAIAFVVLAGAVTIPMYLLTPRSTFERLEFGKPRVEIGYSADQMVDLTKTGNLQANRQSAFEVTATNASGPKRDLSLDQRWRGRIMRSYRAGVWQEGDFRLPALEPGPRIVSQWSPPQLGPEQVSLRFSLPVGARGRFLADPVTWAANDAPPIATITPTGYRPWIWGGNGSFLSDARIRTLTEPMQYVQAWRTDLDSNLSPPFRLIDPDREAIIRPLRENRVPKIKDYADRVLENLVRTGRIPADYADPVSLLPRLEFHALIARAFSSYLATTPDLKYTTELRREKKDMDPVEEFLFHTRGGHCERFATALVLMLRSQGIPAVLVLGFKGCETTDEPGRYVVRQEHAHAWVEALIEEYEPMPWWGFRLNSRWLSLDPTPAGDPNSGDDPWAKRAGSWLRDIYNTYLMDYSPEHRKRAILGLFTWLSRREVLLVILTVIAGVMIARRLVRMRANSRSAVVAPWYERLLAVLAPYGFAPDPGETPREFASRVGNLLRQKSTSAPVAEIPAEWTDAHYESRFGAIPITPDCLAALDARLALLKGALATSFSSHRSAV